MNIEQQLENQLVKASKVIEEHVDNELERLDRLDEDDLDKIRQQRLMQMKQAKKQQEEWRSHGHGSYSEIAEEKDFFDTCKKSKNVVCHFYRDSTFRCKIVDKHLDLLAKKHMECKFIRINVEKAPFLTQRLKIRVIPTLCLVKDEKTKDYVVGFDDLGGHDEFSTEMMEWRIAQADVINYHGDLMTPPDVKEKKNILADQGKKTIRGRGGDDSSDDDDW